MAVSVNIFNPNQFTIRVSVNRGNEFDIPAASPAQSWQPQQPSSNPISFAFGHPTPNTLAGGNNQVMVSGAGGEPRMLSVYIPQVQISSLQLYIFLGEQSSWILLNNGLTIASGTA
jgi:hypothetical protein